MGGGDLNLKKSWHPSTLRNIERVWKAEQKHEVEKQKIEQLQKELAEERAREEIQAYAEDQGVVKKREERLDWMYQGPAAMINREDYLLGRKIDKTLEILEQEESGVVKKNDFDIGSSMFSSQDLSGTATVDLANKIREDPLFSIMKKEKEERKNLLSNPVKMKQLQQMLQESLGRGKKKNKKRHSEESIDVGKRKHLKKKKKHRGNSSPDDHDETSKKKHRNHSKDTNIPPDEDKYYRRSSSSRNGHPEQYYLDRRKDRDHLSSKHASEHHSRQSHVNRDTDFVRRRETPPKMDANEREQRLKEMQENAKWREDQRQKKVMRYRQDDEEEEKASKIDPSCFIKPMLSKAASKGSLENRVKQKMFSIQRNTADMGKHFARR